MKNTWQEHLTSEIGKTESIIFGLKYHPFTTCRKRPLLSALVNFLEPSAHTAGCSTARMSTPGTWGNAKNGFSQDNSLVDGEVPGLKEIEIEN